MTIAQLETNLRTAKQAVRDLFDATARTCQEHVVTPATATSPAVTGRLMTPEERAAIETKMADARAIQAQIEAMQGTANMQTEIERLLADGGTARPRAAEPQRAAFRSIGQQFIDSPTGKWLQQTRGARGANWTSPSAELEYIGMFATTLTEGSGSGGALVVPDYQPGITPYLFRRLVVADLIAPGSTESNMISFMRELAPTNAAATVAEGAAKPESTLVFEAATAPVRKIATWLPVTDEMLEDVPAIRSYIDERLRLFVQLVEDDQLLNGDGLAPNLLGLRNQTGMQADLPRGADTNADAILKQMTLIAVNAFIAPDGVVLNPTNWMTIQLAKDTTGQYYGSGPFAAPQTPMLWGVPVSSTVAMTAGVALPGAFRTGSQFFRRGGLRVEASNSHSDFFTKNLTAIRAEERGALAVYRPGGFGEVTGLN